MSKLGLQVDVAAPCAGAAGPGGGKKKEGGGIGGVIFIIIVLAGSSVYFAGGFIFNWKVKHLEGRERIPHLDFWTGLPGLIKEGVRFLKAKVTRTDCKDLALCLRGHPGRPSPLCCWDDLNRSIWISLSLSLSLSLPPSVFPRLTVWAGVTAPILAKPR